MILLDKISKKIRLIEEVDKFYEGFWISPYGEVISLKGTGANHHVSAIIENPVKFGYTDKSIQDILNKYSGNKSKAKEELVKEVVNKGWIRLRRYEIQGGYTWTINVKRLHDRAKTFITDFFEDYAKKNGTTKYTDTPYLSDNAYIDSTDGREFYSVMDILKYKLWTDAFSEAMFNKMKIKFKLSERNK